MPRPEPSKQMAEHNVGLAIGLDLFDGEDFGVLQRVLDQIIPCLEDLDRAHGAVATPLDEVDNVDMRIPENLRALFDGGGRSADSHGSAQCVPGTNVVFTTEPDVHFLTKGSLILGPRNSELVSPPLPATVSDEGLKGRGRRQTRVIAERRVGQEEPVQRGRRCTFTLEKPLDMRLRGHAPGCLVRGVVGCSEVRHLDEAIGFQLRVAYRLAGMFNLEVVFQLLFGFKVPVLGTELADAMLGRAEEVLLSCELCREGLAGAAKTA